MGWRKATCSFAVFFGAHGGVSKDGDVWLQEKAANRSPFLSPNDAAGDGSRSWCAGYPQSTLRSACRVLCARRLSRINAPFASVSDFLLLHLEEGLQKSKTGTHDDSILLDSPYLVS